MSVSNQTVSQKYACNGVTTTFAIPFDYRDVTTIKVYLITISTGVKTLLTLTTDYTFSPSPTAPTSVVTNTAYSNAYQILVKRVSPATQTADYLDNSAFLAESHETALDKVILKLQETDAASERSIKIPENEAYSTELPLFVADSVLKVNPAGTALEMGPTTTEITNAEANALAAAASAADALTSENNAAASLSTLLGTLDDLNTLQFNEVATPATPDPAKYKMYVSNATKKLTILNSDGTESTVGTGSGINNLIDGGDAEGAQILALYTLSAASRPSGSLTPGAGGLTVSLTSTDPLQGAKSFLLTKGAVNAQGQAAVIDFTAPLASGSATHIITLDYAVVSGTFTAGSDSADSSMIVYIRDTMTGFIQPTNFKFYSNVQGQFTGSFQVISLTASRAYQLLFYVAETSTSAWSMKFDNIQVIKDISATAIFDVSGEMTLTGTQSLTSGVTTKIAFAQVGSQKGIVADTVNNRWVVQTAGRYVALLKTAPTGNVSVNHALIYKNGSAVSNIGSSFTVADNAASQTCFHVGNFAAGDYIEGFCRLDGSSPSLVASNWTTLSVFMVSANTGLSGNPHIAKVATGSAQSIPNATHTLVTTGLSATASFDTATLYDGTNKRMVVKEAGYYEIDYGGNWTINTTGSRIFGISIDGGGAAELTQFEPSATNTGTYRCQVKVRLNAEQTVGLTAYQISGGALNLTGAFLGITKIIDPQSLLNNVAASAPTVQRFTSGSGTYTTPANVKYIQVEMVGGGGGGQGSRETTWAAGAGAGGNTSFGTRTANGGAGGNITGGIGGTVAGSGYTVLASCNGGDGSSGSTRASGGVTEISSGSGAASPFGGNGGGRISGVVGLAGVGNTGSGGSGAGLSTTFSGTSGAGGGAGAYYKFLINNPAANYSYSVGTGGTGGAAGTNGFVGGAGGSGVIIVTEYYS